MRDGETAIAAAVRELHEETGILLSEENLEYAQDYYVVDTVFQFEYHLFVAVFDPPPELTLDTNEHSEGRWVLVEEALSLPLVRHHDAVLLDQLARLQRRDTQLDLFGAAERRQTSWREIESQRRKSLGVAGNLFSSAIRRPWYTALGAPASGKSTALRAMKMQNSQVQLLRETHIARPKSTISRLLRQATDLQQHYQYFHFQMAVLPIRVWQILAGADAGVPIVDECHFTALAYSRALFELDLLTEEEYGTFFTAYLVTSTMLPPPAAVFHFVCPTPILMDRIRVRAMLMPAERRHELQYSFKYIASLARAFATVAGELAHITTVVHVDTARLSADDIAKAHTPR